jgi:biotin carboxyl carrier protein
VGNDRSRDRTSAERSEKARAADHAAIDRLADELLPALAAKLAATGLGEIEVREGQWKVRVRRPAGEAATQQRRGSDKASRSHPGHAGHGHPPAGLEGHRGAQGRGPVAHSNNGSSPSLTPVGPGDGADADSARQREDSHQEARSTRTVATSPAVGVYHPRPEVRPGTKVRSGDRLGAVDMLGIAQEVVAPADGLVGQSLVEPGQAVEYGQELVVIELTGEG